MSGAILPSHRFVVRHSPFSIRSGAGVRGHCQRLGVLWATERAFRITNTFTS
jgi:hypothetical protein